MQLVPILSLLQRGVWSVPVETATLFDRPVIEGRNELPGVDHFGESMRAFANDMDVGNSKEHPVVLMNIVHRRILHSST